MLASATITLLAGLIWPVTLPGPVSSIPDRLLKWLAAGVVSTVVVAVRWPGPTRDPLRVSAARACTLLAHRVRAEADCVLGGYLPAWLAIVGDLAAELPTAVTAPQKSLLCALNRPTGLTTSGRTLVRLIDEAIDLDPVATCLHPR